MSSDNIPGRHAMRWIINDALKTSPTGSAWVEVGVALGKGIAIMGEALIAAGRDDIRLYAVDPWAGTARNGEQQAAGAASRHGDWALFLEMMQAHAPEVLRRLHILRLGSVEAAWTFPPDSVSLCILDADHAHEAVQADIEAWWDTIMMRGGVLGGDDHHETEFPGVGKACRGMFGEDYEVRSDELSWPTWRKVKT